MTKKNVIIIHDAKEIEKTIGQKMETNFEPTSQYTNKLTQSKIDISQTANVIKHSQYEKKKQQQQHQQKITPNIKKREREKNEKKNRWERMNVIL